MDRALFTVTLATALGAGLVGGVLFAFSSFVMRGLARLEPAQGIAAMQAINITAVTPAFMTSLFGTAAGCLALAVWALVQWDAAYGPYLVSGAGAYLAGPVGLTIGYHVPRNERLAKAVPVDPGAARLWARYCVEWTRWNHVRVAAAVAATAAFTLALRTA